MSFSFRPVDNDSRLHPGSVERERAHFARASYVRQKELSLSLAATDVMT